MFAAGIASAAPPPLQMAVTVDPASQRYSAATSIAAELFKRAGVTYQVVRLPPPRAEIMLQQGKLDGDLLRGPAFAEQLPQLIRVEPAYRTFDFAVFTGRRDFTVHGWSDLSQLPFAYRRGLLTVEQATTAAAQRYPVDNDSQCLNMVVLQRVVACVTSEDAPNAVPVDVRMAGRLPGSEVFVYLAPKHRELAARLSVILQHMKASGELEKLLSSIQSR
jgi:polar amino acid transport system substrate-binding protein